MCQNGVRGKNYLWYFFTSGVFSFPEMSQNFCVVQKSVCAGRGGGGAGTQGSAPPTAACSYSTPGSRFRKVCD